MTKKNVVNLVPGSKSRTETESDPSWDEWVIPASDDKGHHSRIYFKAPPSLLGQAQLIIDSKAYPYKSIGYMYRHALVRHYHYLREIAEDGEYRDGVGSTIHAIMAMVSVVRDDEYMEDFRSLFDKLEERKREHLSRGNQTRARQMIMRVWVEIKQMRDDFWRGEFEGELKRRFGELLKPREEGE